MSVRVESDIHQHLRESWLRTEQGLDTLVAQFLRASLSPADWTHRAHLGVASALIIAHGTEAAKQRFREVIPKLHATWASGSESGLVLHETPTYHETLTVFWVEQIGRFLSRQPQHWSRLDRIVAVVEAYSGLRRLYRAVYSLDVVSSADARIRWLPPDLTDSGWPV